MQCLNIKNKEVAALLKEYTDILGSENAAYYVLSENNGYGLDRAPNGAPSKLFSDLLSHYNGDNSRAIQAKAQVYSESFKNWFGDWQSEDKSNVSKVVDKNGEPLVVYHGTSRKAYGFDTIDFSKSDDRISFFTSSNKTMSGSYTDIFISDIEPEYYPGEYISFDEEIRAFVLPEENEYGQYDTYYDGMNDNIRYSDSITNADVVKLINAKIDFIYSILSNPYEDPKYKAELLRLYDINSESELNNYIQHLNSDLEFYKNYKFELKVDSSKFIYSLFMNLKNPLLVNENSEYVSVWNKIYIMNHKIIPDGVYNTRELTKFAKDHNYDGLILRKIFDFGANVTEQDMYEYIEVPTVTGSREKRIRKHGDLFIAIDNPNQIKSIDNQGTFSTQDNNIYNQPTASPTPVGTGRNQQLANILQELYPDIEIGELNDPNLRGQAQVEGNMAGRVLLNAVLENQDTLPHEYAHHYIAWFRNSDIVQKGISRFGGEEVLVQAIGENSVKALRWYNRFFNWVKGLFNKKQAILNRLTYDFLHGREQTTNSSKELLQEIHNQSVSSTTTNIPKVLTDAVSRLLKATSARINTLEHSAVRSPKLLSNLESLTNRFNKLDALESVLSFVDYMRSDVEDAFNILQTYTKQYMDYEKGLMPDNPITFTQLDAIRKGTIGFYNNLYTNLQNLLEDPEVRAYIEERFPNSTVYQDTMQQLKNASNRYAELTRYYNRLSDMISKDFLLKVARDSGSTSVEELQEKLDNGDMDIKTFARYAGLTQYSNSEVIRIVLHLMSEAKYRTHDKSLVKAKELLDLQSKINKSDLSLLFEKDANGNRTGNFVRDRNFGEHERKYKEHMTKLLNDMEVTIPQGMSFGDIPSILNPDQLKRWNKEKNKWDAINSERRFIPAYYDLMNNLSEEARAKKDGINIQIEDLLSKVRDKDGRDHREELTDEEYTRLIALENQRNNLSSPLYMDGTVKTGKDKEIADEIREYNKKLRENVKYTTNTTKFKEAEAWAKANLTPEKFKLWQERNTRDKLSEQFYEDIKELSSVKVKSQDQLAYEAVRSQLIRMYTFDGKVDPSQMPDDVKEFINQLDDLIAEEARKNKVKGLKSRIMEIAEWQVDPNFYKEMEIAFSKSQDEWDAWVARNGRYDNEGNVVPASFWKKLVPRKELRDKYIEKVPNYSWSEVDKNSAFYNKNFDESYGVARVPKKSLYDNSKNFNKIKGNLKALYDALTSTIYEANTRYLPFVKNSNRFQMAQIEGGMYRQLAGASSILKGLGNIITQGVTVMDQDMQYNVSKALEPDGTPVKLIPTRFMKKLDNPNTITDDLVGATILYYQMAVNYDEMSKIAPEMEAIVDFSSRQEYQTSNGGVVAGINSNTHAKLREMVDQFIYGMSDNPRNISFNMFGKKLDISIDKALNNLAAFTRVNGLGNNLFVILTGLATNKIQSRLDAISGIYYDNTALFKANQEIQKSYASALAGIGNPNNKNKALCVLEWSGTVRDFNSMISRTNQSRWTRALQQHFFYGGYAMADYITKGKMALAIMMYYKFIPSKGKFLNKIQFLSEYKDKKKGEADWKTLTTTLYDAFEVKGNQLVVKPEYDKYLDENTKTRVRNTIKQVGSRIDSQLTDLDKNYVSSNCFWKLIFMYRNFLLINLQTKFMTERQYDYSTGMWAEAQYRGAFNYIYRHYINKDKINTLKEMYRNYDELDEFERRLAKRATYEVLFCTFGLYFLSMIIKGIAEDDDDWFKNTAALVSVRTALESRGNILPYEFLTMLNSPSAAFGTIESFITAIQTFFDEPNDVITSGAYKGLKRWQRSLIKITPFRAVYEAQNPEAKLRYYDNLYSKF